ncbi:MAG: sodium:dicarboxylate symporter [Planctomycetaceae bacterium]|nr:sodium:dicarboxylate symporter [Planctomycetaceae bacterium]
MSWRQTITLLSGPVCFYAMSFVDLAPGKPEVTAMAAVALWMAIWWITEAVPLAVTALLPVVLLPALSLMNGKSVAMQYFNHVIFLFIGGFLIALAMERWDLHRRVALRLLLLFGVRPRRMLAAFMFTTALLSMWISNTATAMMMVPIVIALMTDIEQRIDAPSARRMAIGLLLGVAYAASIGGMATLVGTPPNLSFTRILSITFQHAPEIVFADWLRFALPVSIVTLFVAWSLLGFLFMRGQSHTAADPATLRRQYDALGKMTFEQWVILIDAAILMLLWMSRNDLKIGDFTVPGWSGLFARPSFLNDGAVAIAAALPLFMIPSPRNPQKRILDWPTAQRLPWGIILLFGGGFALAKGFTETGLSGYLGEQLAGVQTLHPMLIIAIIAVTISMLTELTSNTATTEMILPVLAGLAVAIGLNPLLLMVPATLSCSCAFMMPVATPPNAIIFGTGRIRVWEMARAGIALNLIGAGIITLATWYWAPRVWQIDVTQLPAWAILPAP